MLIIGDSMNKQNKYIVDLSKSAVFTDKDLELSKSIFNPDTQPEYFHLSEMGLEFVKTTLMEDVEVNNINPTLRKKMLQMFRKGSSKKYPIVKDSFLSRGYDLRAKGIFVLVDDNGNVEWLFSGNTTHDILTKHTKMQNRVVHVFRKNAFFSLAKLAQVGGYFNALDLEFDSISWEDMEVITRVQVDENEIALPKNPTEKQKGKFFDDIREVISFVGNGKFDTKEVKINKLLNDLYVEQTGDVSVITVKNESALLEILRADNPLEYIDGKYNQWVGYSCFSEKILPSFSEKWYKKERCDKVRMDMVIHFGTPNPSDPVKWIRDNFVTFEYEWRRLHDFFGNAYFNSPISLTNRFSIEGFYQQSRELENESGGLLKFGTVIPFEVMKDYFSNYLKD